VSLGGSGRDPQSIGDLDVRAAGSDEVHDFSLAVREPHVINGQHVVIVSRHFTGRNRPPDVFLRVNR
jgi:hypothetical protein